MYNSFFVGQPIAPLDSPEVQEAQQEAPLAPEEVVQEGEARLLPLRKFKPLSEVEEKEYQGLLGLLQAGLVLESGDISRFDELQLRRETSKLAEQLLTPLSTEDEQRRLSLTDQAMNERLNFADKDTEELLAFWQRMGVLSLAQQLQEPLSDDEKAQLEALKERFARGEHFTLDEGWKIETLAKRQEISDKPGQKEAPLTLEDVTRLDELWSSFRNPGAFHKLAPRPRLDGIWLLMRLGFGKPNWDNLPETTKGYYPTTGGWADLKANWVPVVIGLGIAGTAAGVYWYYGGFASKSVVSGRKKLKRRLRKSK